MSALKRSTREVPNPAIITKGLASPREDIRKKFEAIREKGLELNDLVKDPNGLVCRIDEIDELGNLYLFNKRFLGRGDSRNLRKHDPSVVELHEKRAKPQR